MTLCWHSEEPEDYFNNKEKVYWPIYLHADKENTNYNVFDALNKTTEPVFPEGSATLLSSLFLPAEHGHSGVWHSRCLFFCSDRSIE